MGVGADEGGGADAREKSGGAVVAVTGMEGGGVGGRAGGGAAGEEGGRGEVLPAVKALRAAWRAREDSMLLPFMGGVGGVGGGGGVDLAEEGCGGRGAADGGGGGAAGGEVIDGGGGGAAVDGFRAVTGGGGGLPAGSGGGREGMVSEDWVDLRGMSEKGRGTGLEGTWRSFATNGFAGCGGEDSMLCGEGLSGGSLGPGGGGLGAVDGGFGADVRDVSGSELYAVLGSAPVSMPPPLFLSFGIPPANSPPS